MRISPGLTGLRRWIATAAMAALLSFPFAATADPPLWRIRGPHGEIVLFGSVHLLTPGLDWRAPAMEAALSGADEIWFEIPMDGSSDAAAAQAVQARSRLAAGRSLQALLAANDRRRLVRVARSLGLDAQALDGYQPWFVEVTLSLRSLQRSGANQGDGVEQSLVRQAPPAARRRAFETAEEQVRILADAPLAAQAASLNETLRQIEEEPNSFAALQKAWLAGDVGWIVREGVEPLRRAAPDLYRRLVRDRNRRWADQIERLLKTPDRAFIVVGVGHLVGPDSVPALLRRRGLVVEGP